MGDEGVLQDNVPINGDEGAHNFSHLYNLLIQESSSSNDIIIEKTKIYCFWIIISPTPLRKTSNVVVKVFISIGSYYDENYFHNSIPDEIISNFLNGVSVNYRSKN